MYDRNFKFFHTARSPTCSTKANYLQCFVGHAYYVLRFLICLNFLKMLLKQLRKKKKRAGKKGGGAGELIPYRQFFFCYFFAPRYLLPYVWVCTNGTDVFYNHQDIDSYHLRSFFLFFKNNGHIATAMRSQHHKTRTTANKTATTAIIISHAIVALKLVSGDHFASVAHILKNTAEGLFFFFSVHSRRLVP